MHRWLALLLCVFCTTGLLSGPTPAASALPPPPPPEADAGVALEPPYDELSPADEQALWDTLQRNLAALRAAGAWAPPASAQVVTYTFPLRLAPGLPDYAGFRVSAFPDHNPASGATQVLDYNGGARTYDGHHGTDYQESP